MNKLMLLCLMAIGLSSNAQQLVINEIVSGNLTGIKDGYDDVEDWIEIYNPSSSSIDITGYFLSDDRSNPAKWQFDSETIGANDYLIVFASKKASDATYQHAYFSIDLEGEEVYLFDSDTILLDSVPAVELLPDVSYGRYPNGGTYWSYFEVPTPGNSNSTNPSIDILEEPEFDTDPGIYSNSISVEIEHDANAAVVRYTLDGSMPTNSSPVYAGAISLSNNSSSPNVISMIPTNPAFNFPNGLYSETRAQNRGWAPPYNTIDKLNIIRARAFKPGSIPSKTITGSYLIDPSGTSNSLPVITITTENDGLFSDTNGIMVFGIDPDGNYTRRGRESERQIHLSYFDSQTGEEEFEFDGGLRIHGGGGRHSAIKNLRVYTRDSYGSEKVDFEIAGDKGPNEFKRFLIRGPGHRPDCFPRDDMADFLVENLRFDKQHLTYANVYLNGEYWGLYSLKERQDEEHFEEVYDIDEEDLVILEGYGHKISHGESDDKDDFLDFLQYIQASNTQDDVVYQQVKNRIDVDDFIDYQVAEIYFANGDWPNNNVRYWRKKRNFNSTNFGHDGKWRWVFYDLDAGFGGDCSGFFPASPGLRRAMDSTNYANYTVTFRRLLQNQTFLYDFINRSADLLNTSFHPDRGFDLVDDMAQIVDPEMMRQIERWRYPSDVDSLHQRYNEVPNLNKWNEIKTGLKDYINRRPFYYRRHIMDELTGTDTLELEVDVNDEAMGYVKVNSIPIHPLTDGISAPVYPWAGTYFEGVPVPIYAVPKVGYKFVKWDGIGITTDTLYVNLISDSTFKAIFEPDATANDNKFYINEFMASNDATIQDDVGEYPDWIEIYNASSSAQNLENYYITDKPDNLTKYKLTGSTDFNMPGNSFLLLWADDDEDIGPLHISFKLASGGEAIYLVKPDGITIEDSITFGQQSTDVSYGRDGDGDPDWIFFNDPTPNFSNLLSSVNETEKSSVKVYPNPANGQLNFSEALNGDFYDIQGRKVLTFNNVSTLDVSGLANGVYVLISDKTDPLRIIVRKD